MNETWKFVEGASDYQVSSLGRVKSPRGKLLTPTRRSRFVPYLCVSIVLGNKRQTVNVHTLVLEAFSGRRPDGMWCAHFDGDATNNNIENLRWATPSENKVDSFRHGTAFTQPGESHWKARLTYGDVSLIRQMFRYLGVKQATLARIFGVRQDHVSRIVNGKVWRHKEMRTGSVA